jgi:hypothetical protein
MARTPTRRPSAHYYVRRPTLAIICGPCSLALALHYSAERLMAEQGDASVTPGSINTLM